MCARCAMTDTDFAKYYLSDTREAAACSAPGCHASPFGRGNGWEGLDAFYSGEHHDSVPEFDGFHDSNRQPDQDVDPCYRRRACTITPQGQLLSEQVCAGGYPSSAQRGAAGVTHVREKRVVILCGDADECRMQIEITFALDSDGLLSVSAKDLLSGQQVSIDCSAVCARASCARASPDNTHALPGDNRHQHGKRSADARRRETNEVTGHFFAQLSCVMSGTDLDDAVPRLRAEE
eukprot:1036714-Rhodomonas_salina.1